MGYKWLAREQRTGELLMNTLTGLHFIAGSTQAGTGDSFQATNPVTGVALEPVYAEASADQVAQACEAAAVAAPAYAATDPKVRAALLRAIADGLAALGDELVERVQSETA